MTVNGERKRSVSMDGHRHDPASNAKRAGVFDDQIVRRDWDRVELGQHRPQSSTATLAFARYRPIRYFPIVNSSEVVIAPNQVLRQAIFTSGRNLKIIANSRVIIVNSKIPQRNRRSALPMDRWIQTWTR